MIIKLKRINDKEVDEILDFFDVDNADGLVYKLEGEPFNGIIGSFYDNGNRMDEACDCCAEEEVCIEAKWTSRVPTL